LTFRKGLTVLEFLTIVAIICIIAAIAIPNLIEARCGGCESAAIGALKTIGGAQALFREADKEGPVRAGDVGQDRPDRSRTGGTKQNYLFEATYGSTSSELLWIATASPRSPGSHGDRYFVTNHVLNTDCTIPPGMKTVGR
jgi:Tfp pilus assembly protein PilE